MRLITPNNITELKANEIFVFGSNLEGLHDGGAAKFAHLKLGAQYGVGVGPTGQCYAIPTIFDKVDKIKPYVDDFIGYAIENQNNIFLVTGIGCGIAGFIPEQIAPLFFAAMYSSNIALPQTFIEILER